MFLLLITLLFSNVGNQVEMISYEKTVPYQMNYQGYLIEDDTLAVNDTLNMEFKLFTTVTGGTAFWTETHTNTIIHNGIFNIILGSNTSLNASYFTGVPLYLETKIGSETLTPRKKIVTVAYAIRSLYSDSADFANRSDTASYAFSAPAAPDNDWMQFPTFLAPVFDIGISMRQTNQLLGVNDTTHICLGTQSTTGSVSGNDSYCTVGGGNSNSAIGNYSTVSGGYLNQANAFWSTIGGGEENITLGDFSFIGGGRLNSIVPTGLYSAIAGGYNNLIESDLCFIGGGLNNLIAGDTSLISGGYNNQIIPMSVSSNINGGTNHIIQGLYSTIAGGIFVNIMADYCFGWGHGTVADPVFLANPFTIVFGDGTHAPYNFGINNENPLFPLHIGTNPTNGNGAYLTPGGMWTSTSSRTFKENFQTLNSKDILCKVRELNIYRYNYKEEDSDITHITPIAEDFYSLFQTGNSEKYLAAMDIGGVAILAIQELAVRNDKLTEEIDRLSLGNVNLQNRCDRLERELEDIRADIELLKNNN